MPDIACCSRLREYGKTNRVKESEGEWALKFGNGVTQNTVSETGLQELFKSVPQFCSDGLLVKSRVITGTCTLASAIAD